MISSLPESLMVRLYC